MFFLMAKQMRAKRRLTVQFCLATKRDIHKLREEIMALRDDLIDAANLVAGKIDQLIAAVQTGVPGADVQSAITTLNTAAGKADAILNPPAAPPPTPD